MTQYVVETFGRMKQLDVLDDQQRLTGTRISSAAINYLDGELAKDYERLFRDVKDADELRKKYVPSSHIVHYLYARAMSDAGRPVGKAEREALEFYRERAFASWTGYDLYEQALVALAGYYWGDDSSDKALRAIRRTSTLIIESLRERAIRKDEFGMYWKYGRGYRWSNLPIETHTRIFEAFQKIDANQEELDEMRLWLLTNKRTNRWPTTKSTAAAVYAPAQQRRKIRS